MKYTLPFVLCCCLCLVACQNEPPSSESNQPITTVKPSTSKTPPASNPLPNSDLLQQKQPLTTYIKKKLCEQLWHYKTAIVIKQPEKSKAYQGKWVQFKPDNTLLTGFYDEAGSPGRWVYDESSDIITLIEGGERPTYNQWKVKFSSNTDNTIIWVGTSRFQNNNTQIKLVRVAEPPKK